MDTDDYPRRNRNNALKYFLSSLAGAGLMLLLLYTIGPAVPRLGAPQQSPGSQTQYDRLGTTVNTDVTSAAGKVVPSVVGITISKVERGRLIQGVGSGVIVNSSGYILTNNHVAGGTLQSMVVSLYDGRNINGTTVWADPTLDLAIVKINADGLVTAPLGDSRTTTVGQQAIAIGNPLGLTLQRTVTAGIISAVNRTIEVEQGAFMEGLLQTDASINPGNSGGPLVNVKGEVVGINTIKVTTAEGLGFAIPINVAKPVIERITGSGSFATPALAMQVLDRDLGRAYNFVIEKGVYVYDCIDGGCAHKAGIRKGETVLSVNDIPVESAIHFKEALYRAANNAAVKLRVRNAIGTERDVYIRIDGK